MANLIIKPSSGGSLKLQEDGGTDAISIDTSGVSTIANATITAGTFPAGHVLQVVPTTYSGAFSYTNGSQWNWGTSSTRGDNSHGGVISGLNTTLTTKQANSKFLMLVSLSHCSASATGYTVGMNLYYSGDSYATPITRGGTRGSRTRVTDGFWQGQIADNMETRLSGAYTFTPTSSAGTALTFKIALSSKYTSGGNIITVNSKSSSNIVDAVYNMVPVSTLTIMEVAT